MPNDVPYPPARAVTRGPRHHFFGYYEKQQWDNSGRFLLGLETEFLDHPPTGEDAATIGVIDLAKDNCWRPLDQTVAWNWQQGSMLQWMPSATEPLIIYNRRDDQRFVSVIRDVVSGESRVLPHPIYTVSHNGRSALTVNFSRLDQTRPGYGYAGLKDPWQDESSPAQDGIFWMDTATGAHHLIISLERMATYHPNPSMDGATHWFNHLLFNPDGTRFIFLHRWQRPGDSIFWTRLYTAIPDGSDIFCVAGDEYVSHFIWRNSHQILAWALLPQLERRYYLFTDRTGDVEVIGDGILTENGHCSYSPDRQWLLTDTYPNESGIRTLILYRLRDGQRVDIGRFFAPPELYEEIRCDLHPRWSRDGKHICIDSAHTGSRQMYILDVSNIVA